MKPSQLRILFAGTPDFAAVHLQALLNQDYNIIAVLTQPDRPAGRGKRPISSPVKQLAQQHNITVLQPASLRDLEQQQNIAALQCDLMIVVAYGLILPETVLNLPTFGCFNVHGSILPSWRGAAPIQRSVWAGDLTTGVTIIQMDKGLDTGDMLYQQHCEIAEKETSASLYDKLANLGAEALIKTVQQLEQKKLSPTPQDNNLATYAKKLTKEEAKLNWSFSAIELERQIRAFNPWPISYFIFQGQPIKVWDANIIEATSDLAPGTIIKANKDGLQIATGSQILNILTLQPAGKSKMPIASFLNSRRDVFLPGNLLNE